VKVRVVLAMTVALLAVWCAPARADDAGVWSAYNGRDPELDHALEVHDRASHRYQHSHGLAPRRIRAVIAADRGLVTVLGQLAGDVKAEEPSTAIGARAQTFAVRGETAWKLSQTYEIKALRNRLHGHDLSSDRWYRKCLQIGKRSVRYLRRAEAAFKKAGFRRPPEGE
jgi:hypothetical protein